MKIDIVIPSFTNSKTALMLQTAILTARSAEPDHEFNVIVVESSGSVMNVGQDITIHFDNPTFNYNHALNLGISMCKNDWVILANNDLLFSKNFMTEILKVSCEYPLIKSFSPWNHMYGWHSSIFSGEHEIYCGYRIGAEIAGWCIVAKREIFDIFELDERVDFWYSDNVYADSLIKHDIIHALVRKSCVAHLVSQTKVVSEIEAKDSLDKYLKTLEFK